MPHRSPQDDPLGATPPGAELNAPPPSSGAASEPRPSSVGRLSIPVPGWDRYQNLQFLGEGGMGRVYKAVDPLLGRHVALKFIRNVDANLLRSFLREAQSQARIEHPHICRVHEVGEVLGFPYIAMQYINGQSLKAVGAQMTLEQKVKLMREVAEALHAAHRLGLIHRDIKPANIMVEWTEEDGFRPCVLDFGLAREVAAEGQTLTGTVEGTPAYMSPEQARGEVRRLDRRADVYSLGATLYDVLCGRPPFRGESVIDILMKLMNEDAAPLRAIDASIPADLETIVMKCLEKEPQRRYDSAKALADDLGRYMDGEPIRGRRATVAYVLTRKAKKHWLAVAVSSAALLAAAVLGGAALRAERAATAQARLAQQLGQDVKEIELFLRYAYALPLHDTRREKEIIRARMAKIEGDMARLGAIAEGPGRYALGRGHLALREPEAAREHLQKAFEAGYRTSETKAALGLAEGELYRKALDGAQRIADAELRDARKKEVEREHLEPALRLLKELKEKRETENESAAAAVGSADYIAALIALYEGRHEDAARRAREAFDEAPWLYEAKKLEGEIAYAEGNARKDSGRFDEALESYGRAGDAYRVAAAMATSDATLYDAASELWLQRMDVDLARGASPREAFEQVIEACDASSRASPGASGVFSRKSLAYMRLAMDQQRSGDDPRESVDKCIEAGREAVRSSPDDAVSHDTLGNCAVVKGMYEGSLGLDPRTSIMLAVEDFKRAIQVSPSFAWAWNDLGVAYTMLADYEVRRGLDPRPSIERSLENYKAAIRLSPRYTFPHSNICMGYAILARYEVSRGMPPSVSVARAVEACEQGRKLNPESINLFENTALAHVLKAEHQVDTGGNPEAVLARAEEVCSAGMRVDPDNAELYWLTGEASRLRAKHLLDRGADPADALSKVRASAARMLEIVRADPRGPVLAVQAEIIAARFAILQGAPPEPFFERAKEALGRALVAGASGVQVFAASAELERWRAASGLAKKQPIKDLLAEGLAMADKALVENPEDARVLVTQGALRLLEARAERDPAGQQGAARRAKDLFERALQKNPALRRENEALVREAERLAGGPG